ncbi:MAG: class I SAM-dependent RNA methyltransferase [Pseudomonadota bacterium]
MTADLTLFAICPPGLELPLAAEMRALGLDVRGTQPGGVTAGGGWEDVWRANLHLRGATRVLVRLGQFKATSLGELESKAAGFPWRDHLASREPVSLEVTCRKSRISNANAAQARWERALRRAGVAVTAQARVALKLRIDKDTCVISVDTSGEPLFKRGFKAAVSKAPLRESMAAMFLRMCAYAPGEPVLDPLCGSGTIPLEAAEIAAGLVPGRARRFAFEALPSFNPARVAPLRGAVSEPVEAQFYGFDRDAGAIGSAVSNAKRAGVRVSFAQRPVAELVAPDGPPGLVLTNPPYGARIGNPKALVPLYRTLGERLRADFAGWRVGIITSEAKLAQATGLPFEPLGAPVAHGGLKVWLFRTGVL